MTHKLRKSVTAIGVVLGASVFVASCDQALESSEERVLAIQDIHSDLGGIQTPIFDFEDDFLPAGITAAGGKVESISQGEGKALHVYFDAKNNYTVSVEFSPETTWNWSGKENFGLAFDISNPGTHSTQLHFTLSTADGKGLTRAMVVPVGEVRTYYAELKSPLMALNSGLRGDPPTIRGNAEWFVWMWGDKGLDYSNVTSFGFYSRGLKHDREVIIDNVRLVENPPLKTGFLTDIVDEYGQAAKLDFKRKKFFR